MKEKNKIFLGIISMLMVFFMLSTVIAQPINEGKIFEAQNQKNEKNNPKNFFRDLREFFKIFEKIKLFDILKLRLTPQPMDIFLIDEEIIKYSWELYNDTDFRANLTEQRLLIKNEINKYPDYELLKAFFMIDETLYIEKIKERIETLELGQVSYNVQDLMLIPDNLKDMDLYYNKTTERFLTLFKDCNTSEAWIQSQEIFYPVVDFICSLMVVMSFVWIIPLAIAFGEKGIKIGCYISGIILAPMIATLSFYVGACEMFKQDGEFLKEIISKMCKDGLVSCITVILGEIYRGGWFNIGLEYVLGRMHVTTINTSPYGLIIETDEQPPTKEAYISLDETKGNVGFCIVMKDEDIASIDFPYYDSSYRDYLQIGLDFNNDCDIDEWTRFYLQSVVVGNPTYQELWYKFTNGKYKINLLVRDNWGMISSLSSFDFTISKSKSQNMGDSFFNHIILPNELLLGR